MRTLVTGGAGFIGSHLVDALLARDDDVVVVDTLVTGSPANVDSRARFHQLDIATDDLHRVLRAERPEVVFHQAAISCGESATDLVAGVQVDVLGLLNLLSGCVAAGVKKVVFASSGAVYGRPMYLPIDEEHPQRPECACGITKAAAEHYLAFYHAQHGLRYTSLRYGSVYGPRQEDGVVSLLVDALLRGQTPAHSWDGEQMHDYVYVSDVVRANLAAAEAGDSRCYCIGTGKGTSVNQLSQAICRDLAIDVEAVRAPRHPGDPRTVFFGAARAHHELGWEPEVPLTVGLQKTLAWFGARAPASQREVPPA